MSTMYTDDEIENTEEEPQEEGPRGLRRAANKSSRLERERDEARRELAFYKAGINTDDPKMRYFVKGYEGELTAEAVRQAALEAGFISPEPDMSQQAQESLAAQQRMTQASTGAVLIDNSEDAAIARLAQAMEEGGMEAMLDVARQYGIPTQEFE